MFFLVFSLDAFGEICYRSGQHGDGYAGRRWLLVTALLMGSAVLALPVLSEWVGAREAVPVVAIVDIALMVGLLSIYPSLAVNLAYYAGPPVTSPPPVQWQHYQAMGLRYAAFVILMLGSTIFV